MSQELTGGSCCSNCGFAIELGQQECPSCGVVFSRMRSGASDEESSSGEVPGSFDPSLFEDPDAPQDLDGSLYGDDYGFESAEPESVHGRTSVNSTSWLIKGTLCLSALVVVGVVTVLGIGGPELLGEVRLEDQVLTDLGLIESAVWEHVRSAQPFPENQSVTHLAQMLGSPIPTHDPWGQEYRYELAGFSSFRVGSAGPDSRWTHARLASYEDAADMGDDVVSEHGTLLRPNGS
jgi:hypothetical protein